MIYPYYSDKEKIMTLHSIEAMPCPNECEDGWITVYDAYTTDENGLPVGHKEPCDLCECKGYVVSSSEISEAN